jgi:hypothetical protein
MNFMIIIDFMNENYLDLNFFPLFLKNTREYPYFQEEFLDH